MRSASIADGGRAAVLRDRHPPVQQLLQYEQLARALLEAAEVEGTGVEDHRPRLDRGEPADRQEDPPAHRHLGDQPDHPGRLVAGTQPRHRIPYPPDLVTVRVENRQAGEAGDVDPGRRAHLTSLERL